MKPSLFPVALAATLLVGCQGTPATPAPGAPGDVSIGALPIGLVAAGGNLYCICEGNSTIEMRSVDNGASLQKLMPGEGAKPALVRTFIDRRQVIVHDAGHGKLLVYDAGTAAAAGPAGQVSNAPKAGDLLHTLEVAKGVGSLAFGEENATVAFTTGSADKVEVFDFPDHRPDAPRRFDVTVTPGAEGSMRPLDIKGRQVLTADAGGKVQLIPLSTNKATDLGTVGKVGQVAFGLVQGKPSVALATDLSNDSLVALDLAGGTPTKIEGLGKGIADMVVDPSVNRAFIAMRDSDEVAVVDYQAKKLLTKLPLAGRPNALAIAAPTPGEIWAASENGSLAVIAGDGTPHVRTTQAVGKGDHRMTFWGTKGYVANRADGTLSIIERATLP